MPLSARKRFVGVVRLVQLLLEGAALVLQRTGVLGRQHLATVDQVLVDQGIEHQGGDLRVGMAEAEADHRDVGRGADPQRRLHRLDRLTLKRALARRADAGVVAAQRGVEARQADVADHLVLERRAAQDLDLRLDDRVVLRGLSAPGVADIGVVDVGVAQPDQEAGVGDIARLQPGGGQGAQAEHRHEHRQHQPALAPYERRQVLHGVAGAAGYTGRGVCGGVRGGGGARVPGPRLPTSTPCAHASPTVRTDPAAAALTERYPFPSTVRTTAGRPALPGSPRPAACRARSPDA